MLMGIFQIKFSKNFSSLFFVFFLIFGLSACTTVKEEFPLPTQDLESPLPAGKTRVIFLNTTNPVLFGDGSWRIGIKIDGKGVENLHLEKYVQLELDPGIHKLELSHVDVFTFQDSYDLHVGNSTMYVEVYNTILSTKFKVLESEPKDFRKTFEPARKQ